MFPYSFTCHKDAGFEFSKTSALPATFQETMQMLQEEVGPFKEVKGFRCAVLLEFASRKPL